jgi:LytTr DNA-binding domain-containing protein
VLKHRERSCGALQGVETDVGVSLRDGCAFVSDQCHDDSDCEGRLDRSIFFRASRRYIVNLSHVKRLHVVGGSLVFLLKDGRNVALSRRQDIIFRKTRDL